VAPAFVAQPPPTGVPYDGSAAPSWFVDRPLLRTCGYVDLGLDGTLPAERRSCLAGPAGGELGVSRNSTEGDPIVTYYRRRPGARGVTIVTDATRDHFGVRQWSESVCVAFAPQTALLEAAGCRRVH
jgi:hypothetical protein